MNIKSPGICRSAGKITARLLLTFLTASTILPAAASWADGWIENAYQIPIHSLQPPASPDVSKPLAVPGPEYDFTLRHIFHHGTHAYPKLHKRFDIHPQYVESKISNWEGKAVVGESLHARANEIAIQRLSDRTLATVESLIAAARISGIASTISSSAWTTDEVMGPNVTDKETVVSLALMAANAYVKEPGTGEWEDVNGGFNHSDSFGWEGDGLRGHIFADKTNSTIVIAIKGTSPAVFDGAETTTNDKVNDNLFFSCCCGQGGQYLWHQVCDCLHTTYTCNQTCVVKALREENRYYRAALELYGNATELYPASEVWLAGHSLGGAVSSLLGLTFGVPVVTFEAPGEALAAARLGLPSPPNSHPSAPQSRKNTGAYHFGHTADPIFMGSCNGATAGCTLGGYAMESQCHTGQVCIYDVVEDKGWRVGIGTHSIRKVIKDVVKAYDDVPSCEPDTECIDCFNWKYFDSNGSDPSTSTTSSSAKTSQTRTSTCQTPGWWGCLDESTSTDITTSPPATSTSSSMTTTSSSSVTCTTYGWFGGCLDDPTSTTTTSPSTSKKTALPVRTITTTSFVSASRSNGLLPTTRSTTTSTCTAPGIFWGCWDSREATSIPNKQIVTTPAAALPTY